MAAAETPETGADSPSAATSQIFFSSSFFREQRAPTHSSPAKLRTLNETSGHYRATSFNRPPPATLPSPGLFVKYGAEITVAEAETQMLMREHQVPTPETFGWTEDGGQVFIYMDLVEDERQSTCQKLKLIVNAWRALAQDNAESYVDIRPLKDIFISSRLELRDVCGINISGSTPIVFTHNDLYPPNILISARPNPKEEWHTRYLTMVIDPVDDEMYYHPWLYFILLNI
ncbi:hypothetical protein EDB81DRAFT_870702 [Dactylonectria macrodidyma]|uniref:Aminoglycoside phosphotransferase domain-containing protein n=1 Tax=Dactylonectria macrodidyma TaxID=307937 RepID=A0A9P9E8V3_9HYPO|nr:hypothetical protein EDB81DRAFT_870702 [Dactylonectria macrodidyma]